MSFRYGGVPQGRQFVDAAAVVFRPGEPSRFVVSRRVLAGLVMMVARVVGVYIPVGFFLIPDGGLLCSEGLGPCLTCLGLSLEAFGPELFSQQSLGFHTRGLVDHGIEISIH